MGNRQRAAAFQHKEQEVTVGCTVFVRGHNYVSPTVMMSLCMGMTINSS